MHVAKAFAALVGLLTVLALIIDPYPPAPRSKVYYATMRADLRNLVTAQETFFADSQRFAAAFDRTAYATSSGVRVSIALHGDSAWSAVATHVSVTASCRISVSFDGTAVEGGRGDGEPVCEPPPPTRGWRFRWEY